MTIENLDAYIRNLWDWNILNGCFGGSKIEPTDIDGFVEHNGHFLVLETKAPTTDLTNGQRLAFERLVDTGVFTVVIAWGHKNSPERLMLQTKNRQYPYEPANLETLRRIVAWWYKRADGPKASCVLPSRLCCPQQSPIVFKPVFEPTLVEVDHGRVAQWSFISEDEE